MPPVKHHPLQISLLRPIKVKEIHSILFGVFLNKRSLVHNIVQTVSFTPHIIASVSIAVIFMWLMDPNNGVFNMALKALHLPTSYWYKGRDSALFSIIIVSA